MALTPEERQLRARIAAHARWSRRDSHEDLAPAREAFLERFRREVDPEGVLPPGERERRAQHALKAHMYRLALASARARRARREVG
ncbi:MAG TPA: hypothetical protein VNO79_07860 [Actinomycetota bacterium]|nr:hypothetical protein [Actinomycetota bacterium]